MWNENLLIHKRFHSCFLLWGHIVRTVLFQNVILGQYFWWANFRSFLVMVEFYSQSYLRIVLVTESFYVNVWYANLRLEYVRESLTIHLMHFFPQEVYIQNGATGHLAVADVVQGYDTGFRAIWKLTVSKSYIKMNQNLATMIAEQRLNRLEVGELLNNS